MRKSPSWKVSNVSPSIVVRLLTRRLAEETGKAKPNLNVLAEWRRREAEYLDRARDLETVTAARDQAKQRYDDLRKARLEGFMTGFNAISSKLKEMYQVRSRSPVSAQLPDADTSVHCSR